MDCTDNNITGYVYMHVNACNCMIINIFSLLSCGTMTSIVATKVLDSAFEPPCTSVQLVHPGTIQISNYIRYRQC